MAEHDTPNDFHYDPLSVSGSLRLLEVLPERRDDRLQIRLWESPPTVPYRCLSYMWGDQAEKYPMLVNGHVFEIGKSLYTFLEIAQLKFPNESLWIDAICINQSDNREKSLQVQRMGKTFSNADEVLIWLGHDKLIAELLEWTASMCDENEEIDESRVRNPPESIYKALVKFSSHPYWKRAWITQEVMLSQRSRLLCGVIESTAKAVSTLLYEYFNRVASGSLKWELGSVLSMLIKIGESHRPISLWTLARERRKTQCKDPRDRLYSLLAIIGHEATLLVDYQECLVGLYLRSVIYFSAWKKHSHMAELGYLLGLDYSTISARMQSGRLDLYLNEQVRHSVRWNKLDDIPKWSPRHVRSYSARESFADAMFLHLESMECEEVYNRTCLEIQQSWSSGAAGSFPLETYSLGHRSVQCPANTEVWSSDGSVTKLSIWNDMIGIIGSTAQMEDTEEVTQVNSEAEFVMVKLPLRAYIAQFLEKWKYCL